jgi:hypothetical protein
MPHTIHVVYSNDGKILAASEFKNPPRPKNTQGVTVGEFEVPAHFGNKRMHEYIPRLMVDIAGRHLKEKGEEHKGKERI